MSPRCFTLLLAVMLTGAAPALASADPINPPAFEPDGEAAAVEPAGLGIWVMGQGRVGGVTLSDDDLGDGQAVEMGLGYGGQIALMARLSERFGVGFNVEYMRSSHALAAVDGVDVTASTFAVGLIGRALLIDALALDAWLNYASGELELSGGDEALEGQGLQAGVSLLYRLPLATSFALELGPHVLFASLSQEAERDMDNTNYLIFGLSVQGAFYIDL